MDPHALHFGPYTSPAFEFGDVVECEVRGPVRIIKLTDAPIPWPIGIAPEGGRSLVVYGDLARAVRREANKAVAHHWGVTGQTITKIRRGLGIGRTEGDTLLFKAYGKRPEHRKAMAAMWATARDPVRRSKIAEAKRGKPRPAAVVEKMRAARLGAKASEATKAKMRAARVGRRPPWLNPGWSAAEDELCRTLPAAEVSRQTGRSISAVYNRRNELGVNDGRTRRWSRS
jgi:hypothetical protein